MKKRLVDGPGVRILRRGEKAGNSTLNVVGAHISSFQRILAKDRVRPIAKPAAACAR